jgi:hypothetical protein
MDNLRALYTKLSPWNRGLLEKLTVIQLGKKFPAFYEPKGSLPCSQRTTTGPYPEPKYPPKSKALRYIL